ncbi:Cholesterol 7-alpha-monooxygenase [Daldinia childiae]|uniref:Cholesterol 7-alpha-monooxygenase n=1 Tax=Daldinia childiae TaxID=326645 RepID=UPI0014457A37|nr:Cholesterol 7-alpha-monooxygenase [Daldinia childiae]KAF3063880.1 Cholesterol 7-alpha-monooxygenase [Daldinia childiae]
MLHELIYSSIGLVLLAYALDYAIGFTNDVREPKRVNPKVPLIGHLLGMVKYGGSYFTHTSIRTKDEIYTLPIFNAKIYVSNSLRLVPLIQKASKTLSFRPFHKTSIQKISGCSAAGANLFDGSLTDDYDRILRTTLAPGPWLDEQNLRMGHSSAAQIDAMIKDGEEKKILLLEWARHIIVQASSCGIFGQEHPFLDPEVEKAFWKLQAHLPIHMASLDFFGQVVKSHEVMHKAFLNYCAAPPADAARTLLERQRVLREAGMSFEDAAKQETSMCMAMFGSTVPTLYWTIWELFSRPKVLAEVREEIETQAVSRKPGEEKETHDADAETDFLLDVTALKTRCPLLLSVFQETQRTRHVHANIRLVLEDTFLDDGRYLLRKGNFLMMPGSPIHRDVSVWGQSAGTFNPYRFVPNPSKVVSADAVPPPSGFLSWGAPPYLCPARQFASTEILIIMALLAMQVDLIPATNNSQWEQSPALDYGELVTVFNPARDVEMYMKPREQGVGKWTLKMGESKTRVPIASG